MDVCVCFTWTIYNTASKKKADAKRKPPRIQFEWIGKRNSSAILLGNEAIVIGRPLNRVTINAPVIDTIVPIHIARQPVALKSSFSNLKHPLDLRIFNFQLLIKDKFY